ncbi:hypothetical protein LguiB_022103 [Lonicera macranthoides]
MSKSEKKEGTDTTIREMGLVPTRESEGGELRDLMFFSVNGFPCPTLQNPSDHFLRTTNKDFDEDIEQGGSNGKKPIEDVIDMLINSYKSSDNFQQVLIQVAEICEQGGGALMEKKRSHASFVTQCIVLTKRSFVNTYRDLGYNSVEPKCSMLMFVASYLTFMAISGFPSFVEDMKVFQRERLKWLYGTAYYITGLQNDIQHFTYYILVLLTCMMMVESLMMIVASIIPNFRMGIILGAGIQGLMILGEGFFRKPHSMPKLFWNYPLYNIAFHKYAFQGLYKNEFEGVKFHVLEGGRRHMITGEYILKHNWQVEMGYSKWVDLSILLGMMVLYRILFLVIIKCIEKFRPAIRAFMSSSQRKRRKQKVMVNPNATPLHGATI